MTRGNRNSVPPHDPEEWGANYWNCHVYYIRRRGVSVEDPNQYHRGGFHPVLPADVLGENGRFRVVQNLGVGGFGTVWVCRDKQEQKWRALKILSARNSDPDMSVEMALTKYFKKNKISHAEMMQSHVSMPLDYFWIEGPNGKHQVQVMELLGPNLTDFFKFYARCHAIIKDTCIQLVDAMDFLHSNRICHGDFRPENIMVQLIGEIHDWSEEQLLRVIGKPDHIVVFRSNQTRNNRSKFNIKWDAGVPKYLVPPANIDFGSGICSKEIAVSDFGVSYTFSRTPEISTGIPLQYAAPESYFSVGGLGPGTDVWSLACTIAYVATGRDLLYHPSTFRCVAEMGTYMGPMPKTYQQSMMLAGLFNELDIDKEMKTGYVSMIGPRDWYKGTIWEKATAPPEAPKSLSESEVFTTPSKLSVTPKCQNVLKQYSKDEYRAKFEWRDKEGVEKLADLLQSMLKWTPEARPKTGDLVSHPWFDINGVGDLDDFTEEEQAYWGSMGATATGEIEPGALGRQWVGSKHSKQREVKRKNAKHKEGQHKRSRRRSARRKHWGLFQLTTGPGLVRLLQKYCPNGLGPKSMHSKC
ncbi:kinase-like domain-containing protein [Cladorrhinum sp. PSN259]|nr:kinase-like domain-containing protein [Cladorrhinum sp. PSN259]